MHNAHYKRIYVFELHYACCIKMYRMLQNFPIQWTVTYLVSCSIWYSTHCLIVRNVSSKYVIFKYLCNSVLFSSSNKGNGRQVVASRYLTYLLFISKYNLIPLILCSTRCFASPKYHSNTNIGETDQNQWNKILHKTQKMHVPEKQVIQNMPDLIISLNFKFTLCIESGEKIICKRQRTRWCCFKMIPM